MHQNQTDTAPRPMLAKEARIKTIPKIKNNIDVQNEIQKLIAKKAKKINKANKNAQINQNPRFNTAGQISDDIRGDIRPKIIEPIPHKMPETVEPCVDPQADLEMNRSRDNSTQTTQEATSAMKITKVTQIKRKPKMFVCADKIYPSDIKAQAQVRPPDAKIFHADNNKIQDDQRGDMLYHGRVRALENWRKDKLRDTQIRNNWGHAATKNEWIAEDKRREIAENERPRMFVENERQRMVAEDEWTIAADDERGVVAVSEDEPIDDLELQPMRNMDIISIDQGRQFYANRLATAQKRQSSAKGGKKPVEIVLKEHREIADQLKNMGCFLMHEALQGGLREVAAGDNKGAMDKLAHSYVKIGDFVMKILKLEHTLYGIKILTNVLGEPVQENEAIDIMALKRIIAGEDSKIITDFAKKY